MRLVDRILARVYDRLRRAGLRSFQGAKNNRLTSDWRGAWNQIDQDIRADLNTLRARSRDLAQNNPHVKRYLRLLQMNVAGPSGFTLQVDVENEAGTAPDQIAIDKISEAFKVWSERFASVDGILTFRELTSLALKHAARDGEFLLIERPRGPFGYSLQLLEPELLDESYNTQTPGGNYVRLGVELDGFRRPIAYYLREISNDIQETIVAQTRNRIRIPAEQVIHGFDKESAFMTRGVPWTAPIMLTLRQLGEYQTAAVTKARVSATSLGFVIPSIDNPATMRGTPDDQGNVQIDLEPLSVNELDPGMEFKSWESEYPSEQFEPFVKAVLRSVASGLDISYISLAGDYSEANYSSARVAMLDERESYRERQTWLREILLDRVFRSWLRSAILSGSIRLPMGIVDRVSARWIGRTWDWIDPQNETSATIEEITAGLDTLTNKLATRGRSLQDVLQELAEEKRLAEKLGLELTTIAKKTTAPAPAPAPAPALPSNGDGKTLKVEDRVNG